MDTQTRKKYLKWRRKKILKKIFFFLATVFISYLIIHLVYESGILRRDEPVMNIENYETTQNIEDNAKNLVEKIKIYDSNDEDVAIIFGPPINPCIGLDFTPIVDVMTLYGATVAIHFENLATGCTFYHREEDRFFGASLMKAPFALWLYEQADFGFVDLSEELVFQPWNKLFGSGIIRHEYPIWTVFNIERLIGLNLYESDNTATEMLQQRFEFNDFAYFIRDLAGVPHFYGNVLYSYVNAREVGTFARSIFNYIESATPNAIKFKTHLLNNQFPFIQSDFPVASKTGWYHRFGGAWHDMAIIYAPSPFSLVLLSSHRTGEIADYEAFTSITSAFEEFNRINFE